MLGWRINRAAPVSCQTERQLFFSHESNIALYCHIILFYLHNFLFDTPSAINNKACIGIYFHNHLKQIQSYEHCIHKIISPKIVRYLRFPIIFKFKTDSDRTRILNSLAPISRCRTATMGNTKPCCFGSGRWVRIRSIRKFIRFTNNLGKAMTFMPLATPKVTSS